MPDAPGVAAPGPRAATTSRARQRGQVLAIFAGATILFVAILALVVDVSWYWTNSLKVQRAADAAALAGVVWLPGDVTRGVQAADAAAAQNGYAANQVGISISASQDSQVTAGGNPNQMDVTISAPVQTFFMRLFGITKITASKSSHAVYVLPVPMGSPLNYFGDFGKVRHPGGGTSTSTTTNGQLGPKSPAGYASGGDWSSPANAYTSDGKYATSTASSSGNEQSWDDFGLSLPSGATVDGVEVDVELHASSTHCTVSADLSWNDGSTHPNSWTTVNRNIGGIGTTDTVASLGGPTDDWNHSWGATDLNNSHFLVRLTDEDGSNCDTGSGRNRSHTVSVDHITVTVYYHVTVTTTIPDANLTDPNGGALAPQGFWGTVMSQGGESLNGDIYSPYYDNNGSPKVKNTYYDAATYYNYDITMPAGSSAGQVWLYDAPFCATDGSGQYGTGDRWFGNAAGISTYYDLYDTRLTEDTSDDTLAWSSGNTFAESKAFSDADLDGSGGSSCSKDDTVTSGQGPAGPDGLGTQCTANLTSGIDCHLRWYELPVTLAGGKTYRLHVTTTGSTSQLGADGHNSFTIWSTASGGTPHVFGVGAMETFEPLPGGGSSIFYLAQIGAEHAGKTMQIQLWDPGDTSPLSASLKILAPTTTGYVASRFSWSAEKVNSQGQSCKGTGSNTTSVTTNVGDTTGTFNGCWLTIDVAIPTNYTAPQPPGETHGGGWWKIEYDMGGSSSDSAFDLTTWQVNLLGNPVHLVIP